MRRSRSSTALVALLLGLALAGAAAGQGATANGAAFLLLPVGARAAGLGQAVVSDRGTADAAFWNPAGLARLPSSQFVAHFASTFISNNGVVGGYYADDRVGTLGLAAYIVDYGSQEVIPPGSTTPIGRIALRNVELQASYATPLTGSLAFGVNYKLIQFRQDCSGDCRPSRPIVGTTHAVDLGLQWSAAADHIQFGVALRHAGFKLQLENRDQADPLPTRLVVGASWTVPVGRLDDGSALDARFLVNFQDHFGEYGSPEALVGAELGYGDLIRLRAGYALVTGESRGPALGVGFQYESVTIDFARVFYASGAFDEPAYLSLRVGL